MIDAAACDVVRRALTDRDPRLEKAGNTRLNLGKTPELNLVEALERLGYAIVRR